MEKDPAPQELHLPKSPENLLGECQLLSISSADVTFALNEMEELTFSNSLMEMIYGSAGGF